MISDKIKATVENGEGEMSDTCMTCRYWMHIDNHADFPDEPLAHWGLCRRYPPAVGHAEDSGYGFNSDTPGGWPITDGTDWCGEYVCQ